MAVTLMYATPKQIESYHEPGTTAFAMPLTKEAKDYVLLLPYGASTRRRIHELAHAKKGHYYVAGQQELQEVLTNEVDAEVWSYSKQSKPLSIIAVLRIADIGKHAGAKASWTFTIIIKQLAVNKVKLSSAERSRLWQFLTAK